MTNQLPNFCPVPSEDYDPFKIVKSGDDAVGAFFLALATVFNDLKGIVWFHSILIRGKPEGTAPKEEQGQWDGMIQQVNKYAIAIVHELFKFIEKNREILELEEFQRIESRIPSRILEQWETIVSLALSNRSTTEGQFALVLKKIRNNVSFHYYQPKVLVEGYRAHFDPESDDPLRTRAYISFGNNMAETRFFYGDAAVESAVVILTDIPGFSDTMYKILDFVSISISQLVMEFVRSRTE